MVADLEKEYHHFLQRLWQRYSRETASSGESAEDLGQVYDNVSLASNEFLRDRLRSLEETED
ncbi:MAG: hypothetical protein ACYTEL_09765 [Planctomycetota bacterium]